MEACLPAGPGWSRVRIAAILRRAQEEAIAMLVQGDTAPPFKMAASGGRTVASAAFAGRPYVLYFYPKADTPGCTTQACAFQETLPELGGLGVDVIGVSRDPIAQIDRFAARHGLTFPLASDPGEVSEAYGVWAEKSMYGRKYMGMLRATFLVDGAGIVARVWPAVKINGHAAEVARAAAELG